MDTLSIEKKYIYASIIGVIIILLIGVCIFIFRSFFSSQKSAINGVFTLSGNVPSGSIITLLAKEVTASSFTVVQVGMAAQDLTIWQDNKVEAGKSYVLKGQLMKDDQIIAESNEITVVAPAINQVLSFVLPGSPSFVVSPTPQAIRPTSSVPVSPTRMIIVPTSSLSPSPTPVSSTSAQTASTSGTIAFTGQAPVNSRIVIFQKAVGADSYQVAVDNVIPYNSNTWVWNGGTSGNTYSMVAILKQKQSSGVDTDLVTSNTLTVSVPSSTNAFTLTYSPKLTAPGSDISRVCNSFDGSKLSWPASLSFKSVPGAASYWFSIGTTDGGIELANFTQNATNTSNQVITELMKDGVTYYAKYAYSGVPNVLAGSAQFSPLSSSVQLKCP